VLENKTKEYISKTNQMSLVRNSR